MTSRRPVALLLALATLLATHPASARKLGKVSEVELLDWGASGRRIVGTTPAPGSVSGYSLLLDPDDDTPLDHGDHIDACLGTQFGIEFRLRPHDDPAPDPRIVVLDIEWTHPPMRIPNGDVITSDHFTGYVTTRSRLSGWVFEKPYELIPGPWTITLRTEGRVVLQKTFQVDLAQDCAAPTS